MEKVHGMKRNETVVVKCARKQRTFIAVQHDEFIGKELGKIYECIFAEVGSDYSKSTKIGM